MNGKLLSKKVLVVLTCILGILPFLTAGTSAYASEKEASGSYFNDGTLILGEREFETLKAIEEIPDEIIAAGSQSINQYFLNKGIKTIIVSDKTRNKRGVVGCISAVGIAIVVNFTPAKIAKAKSVLKAVGGAAKYVQKAVGLYNKYKAFKHKAEAARIAIAEAAANVSGREILLDLFSLGSVYSECFE